MAKTLGRVGVERLPNFGNFGNFSLTTTKKEAKQMDKQAIKDNVVENILHFGDQSFVGIEHTFEEYSFNYKEDGKYLISPENNSIVLWHGWNDEAVQIIQEVMRENQIKLTGTDTLVYLVDGRVLNLPVATKINHHYKEARWYPMLFVQR